MGAHSSALTSNSIPYLAYLCPMAAVSTWSGYSYFGKLALPAFTSRSFTPFTSSVRSGAVMYTVGRPYDVTKLVLTSAPFA